MQTANVSLATLSDLLDNAELLVAGMGNDAVEAQVAKLRAEAGLEDSNVEAIDLFPAKWTTEGNIATINFGA